MQAIQRRQWIATRLKQLGKKSAGLASALGIERSRVSEILKGSRRVQVNELPAFADYLEMSVQQLLPLLRDEADGEQLATTDAGSPASALAGHDTSAEGTIVEREAENFNQQVRQRLIEVRKGLGWSQSRMASALGVSGEKYKKYETYSVFPIYLLPRLVFVSGRTFSWLLTGYG